MGNNVFVRFAWDKTPEIFVIQSEATPGNTEVTSFVDGTNGGLFFYENDLYQNPEKLIADLRALVDIMGSSTFDELVERARNAWMERRTPEMVAGFAQRMAERHASAMEDAGIQGSVCPFRREALESHIGWYIRQFTAGGRKDHLRPVLPLTVLTSRCDDGDWIGEIPEFPGVRVTGGTREEVTRKGEALALHAIADQMEEGAADAVRAVLFTQKQRGAKRRK